MENSNEQWVGSLGYGCFRLEKCIRAFRPKLLCLKDNWYCVFLVINCLAFSQKFGFGIRLHERNYNKKKIKKKFIYDNTKTKYIYNNTKTNKESCSKILLDFLYFKKRKAKLVQDQTEETPKTKFTPKLVRFKLFNNYSERENILSRSSTSWVSWIISLPLKQQASLQPISYHLMISSQPI